MQRSSPSRGILVIGLLIGLVGGLIINFIPGGVAAGLVISGLILHVQNRYFNSDCTN